MPLICVLNLLAKSLDSSLTVSTESLDEVGRTKSINSFEVEMRNWTTVFFLYGDSASAHFERCFVEHDEQNTVAEFINGPLLSSFDYSVTKNLLEYSFSSIMDLTQKLFDVLQYRVQKSVLIPRVKNHLILGTTKIRSRLLDHYELIVGLTMHNQQNFTAYHQDQICITDLMNGQADGGEWVINWLKANAKETDQDILNQIKIAKSRN